MITFYVIIEEEWCGDDHCHLTWILSFNVLHAHSDKMEWADGDFGVENINKIQQKNEMRWYDMILNGGVEYFLIIFSFLILFCECSVMFQR